MIQLNVAKPQREIKGYLDTWKDSAARAECDKAAAAVEAGDLNGYWGTENVQIGENRNAKLAKEEAGYTAPENGI